MDRSALVSLACALAIAACGVNGRPPPAPAGVHPSAAFFDRVIRELRARHSVKSRAGIFQLESWRGYDGRNPRTGAVVKVPPKSLISFIATDELASAALAERNGESFADAQARIGRTADDDESMTIAPSVDVACSDEALREIASSLRALVASGGTFDWPQLGTFSLRAYEREHVFVIIFQTSDELKTALDAPP